MGEACVMNGEEENVYRILVRKSKGKKHLKYPGIHDRIILK
jgi:hypothetical protein